MYKLPILISVPHGGNIIPAELSSRIALTKKDIFEDGDPFTREIYGYHQEVQAFIDTEIARAFIDLNRAPADRPPHNPDGVIKTVTTMNVPVYKSDQYPDENLIEFLLKKYYIPYHQKIDQLQQNDLIKCAFDCHSMLPMSPIISKNPGQERPLICLSNSGDKEGFPTNERNITTCPAHLMQKLANHFCEIFKIEQSEVTINDPFLGGYILQSHYNGTIPWIQLEINRKLYLSDPYLDKDTLTVSSDRIVELKDKIFKAMQMFISDFY